MKTSKLLKLFKLAAVTITPQQAQKAAETVQYAFFITPLHRFQNKERQILALMKLPQSLYQLHLKPCET